MTEIKTKDRSTITIKARREGSNEIQLSIGREDNFSFVWASIQVDEARRIARSLLSTANQVEKISHQPTSRGLAYVPGEELD